MRHLVGDLLRGESCLVRVGRACHAHRLCARFGFLEPSGTQALDDDVTTCALVERLLAPKGGEEWTRVRGAVGADQPEGVTRDCADMGCMPNPFDERGLSNSEHVRVLKVCGALIQASSRDPIGEPWDGRVLENCFVAMQMATEPVGFPYPLPGDRAAIAYLWETARTAPCPYRNRVLPYLRMYAIVEWLPQRAWLNPRLPYNGEVPDREVLTIMSTSDLPYPHNFTTRCDLAAEHTSLLDTVVEEIRRKSPELAAEDVMSRAVETAGHQWAKMLATKQIPPCPRHSLTKAQFEEAVMLAAAWIRDEPGAEGNIQPTLTDPVRLLAWSLIHDPIAIGATGGDFRNGQGRLCQARELGVAVVPVAVLP